MAAAVAPKYEVQRLTARHRQVLRLDLAGVSPGDISRQVGLSPAMVRYVRASTVYRDELERLQRALDHQALADGAAMRRRLQGLGHLALDELEGLLAGDIPARLRAQVCWWAPDAIPRSA